MDGDEEYEEEFEDDFIQEDEGEDEEEEEEGETQLHGVDDKEGFSGAEREQHNPGITALTRNEGGEEEEEEEPIIEDDADDLGEGDDGEDPLEAKIAEEHARFNQAQAQWQEKVRAERPWSAPPLGSPSVQEQRQRTLQTAELQAAVSSRPDAAAVAPRAEYQPPARPYIEASVARGGQRLSYLAPPRPISADAARSMHRNTGSSSAVQRPGFLQDILEDAPLESPGRASWGARLSTADVDSPIPASPTSAVAEEPELRDDATEARVASRSTSGGGGRGDGEGDAEVAGDGGSDGRGSQAGSEVGSEVAPAEGQGEEAGAGEGEGEGEGEPFAAVEEVAEGAGAGAGVELEMSFGELSKGGLGAEGAEGAEGSADAGDAGEGEGLDEPDDPPQLSRSLSFTLGNQQPSASAVSTPVVFRPMQPLLTFPAVKASPSSEPFGDSPTASEASFAPAFGTSATIIVPTILSPPTPSSPGGSPTASPTKPGPASSIHVEESEPPPHEQLSGSGAQGDRGALLAREAGSPAAAAPQSDYGGMMSPHAFALQLLDHDLRTLPAFQEAETAAAPRAPTHSPPRPALAQYGYLGFQGPDPGAGAQGHSQQGARRTASGQAASSSPSASGPASVPSALRPSTAPARRSNPGNPKRVSAGADEGLLRNSRYPPRPATTAAAQRQGLARSESVDTNGEAGAARAVRIAQALRRPYSAVHTQTTRVVEPQAPEGASSPEADAELVSGLIPLPGTGQVRDQSHYQPHGVATSSEAWSSDAWPPQGQDPASAAAAPSGTAVPGWGRAEVSGMAGGQQGAWVNRPGPTGGEGQGRLGQGAGARPSKRGGSDQRPKSAGPTYNGSAGGQYGLAGGLGLRSSAGNVGYIEPGQGRAMLRPHSAQPAMGLRGWEGSALDAGRVSLAHANGNQTAAVSVGGQAVSVYVADTQRRVVEANRWAAALGVGRRYRLKSPTSNMLVQLVASGSEGGGGPGGGADAARVLKTMTLTQFLVAHGELKAKAAAMAAQGPPQEGGHIRAHRRAMRSSDGADGMPPRDPGRARAGRPWSAAPGAGGSGGGGGGGMIRPRSGSADYGQVVSEPHAVAARGSFDGAYGLHGVRDRQHSIYEVTPSGHVMLASTDPHEHLQRAVAAAQRCQELAQQVNYLRRHSEAWQ